MSSELAFETLHDSAFTPHHYQTKAIESVTTHFYEKGRKAASLVLATGAGKTVVMAELVRSLVITEQVNRALFVVHRNELVKQAIETFELAGLAVGREQGSQHGMALCNPNIICSTVQSMAVRKAKYEPQDFDLILVDEHHHFSWDNKQYRGLVEYFDTAKLLGVTATPDRPDGKDMTHFDEVVYSYNLFDAIHDPQGPFLSPVRFVRCDVGVDLRGCRTIGHKGDFDAAELGKRIQPAIEIFANAIAKEIADRQKIIVFMPCVGSSTAMANALKDLGFRADWVSGDRKDKDQVIQDYKKGRLQILVNCQLLLEGFDDKETDTVVLKPTRSRVAYAQAVGRGTRLYPGKKDCLVIDFSHTSDLDLVGPASLAVADIEDAKAIDKLVDQDDDGDLWGAIERNEENKKQRRIFHVPISRMESMEYRRVEVNPFQTMINLGSNQTQLTSNSFSELASEPQISFLAKSGMGDLGNISKRQASELISKIIDRRTSGLCSLRQLNYLISLGVKPDKARHMSFKEATETISVLRVNS
jgi:superfamily II DNA or RNA helicase